MYLSIERNKIIKAPNLQEEALLNPIFKDTRLGLVIFANLYQEIEKTQKVLR